MILSIITLTFNNPEELELTLQSIPEFKFIEHVIVNGGKPSDEIIKKYNPKALIINEPDSGIADAFNKGTKKSNGELLMYLNSGDTIIDQDYIIKAYNLFLEQSDIHFVHSNLLFIDDHGGDLTVKPRMKNEGRGMKYLHPTMIIRRQLFDEIKGYDTSYKIAMDYDFILRAEGKGFKGYYLNNKPVVKMAGGGKSQQQEFQAIKECYRSLKTNRMLSVNNAAGLILRISLFYLRKLLLSSGGGNLLGRMKRIKYSGDSQIQL